MVLLSLFLRNRVIILIFTVLLPLSGFWPFSFKPPLAFGEIDKNLNYIWPNLEKNNSKRNAVKYPTFSLSILLNISIFPSMKSLIKILKNMEKIWGKGWWSGTKVFQSRTLVVQIEHNIAKFGQKLFSYYPDIYKIGIGSRTQ